MYTGKMLFAQRMDYLPWTPFTRIVSRYAGDRRIRTFSSTEHFRILAFAQLTSRESLRNIEACLSAQSARLYHRQAFARQSDAPHWLMPTKEGAGGSLPSSPNA